MTNETQKTAVEWYSRRLFEIEIAHNQGVINSDVYLKSKTHAFEQAKEMEKEQIIEAFEIGIQSEFFHQTFNAPCKDGEQYYTETYKQ